MKNTLYHIAAFGIACLSLCAGAYLTFLFLKDESNLRLKLAADSLDGQSGVLFKTEQAMSRFIEEQADAYKNEYNTNVLNNCFATISEAKALNTAFEKIFSTPNDVPQRVALDNQFNQFLDSIQSRVRYEHRILDLMEHKYNHQIFAALSKVKCLNPEYVLCRFRAEARLFEFYALKNYRSRVSGGCGFFDMYSPVLTFGSSSFFKGAPIPYKICLAERLITKNLRFEVNGVLIPPKEGMSHYEIRHLKPGKNELNIKASCTHRDGYQHELKHFYTVFARE
jgi:hypothetical protein